MLRIAFENSKKGIIFAILAPLFYALKSSTVKLALPIKVEQLWFLRLIFDIIILSPLFFRNRKCFSSRHLFLHFFRAALVTFLSFISVYMIRKLALTDVILLESSFPLFIPLVLWIWHRKKITLYSWIILLLGFLSIFFLTKLRLDYGYMASCIGLGIALLTAVALVTVNTLATTESSISILFYYYLFSVMITLSFCTFSWDGIPTIPAVFWLPFIFHSIFGVLFQYSVVQAYSLIAAHYVGAFSYFAILFSTLFSWLIWKESLSGVQIIGGVLLIVLGLLIICERGKKSFLEIKPKKLKLTSF
ncbi:MAG: DMT family transporter [Parachlamydiales bacterium]|nr:DMT family transporter [Candidatus Acheromyda pituitae]